MRTNSMVGLLATGAISLAGRLAVAALVWLGPAAAAELRAEPAAIGEVAHISIGTGSPTGIYFALGNAICRLINRRPGPHRGPRGNRPTSLAVTCSAPATPGSIYNLGELRTRGFTFGLVQSDWQYHAHRGSSRFTGQPFPSLRSVLSVHPEAFQLLAGRGAGIPDFASLVGKRVSLGPKGSGTRSTFDVVLEAHGVAIAALGRADELALTAQTDALCNGDVDAIAFTIGIPSGLVAEAMTRCGASLVDLTGPALSKLVEASRFYAVTRIAREAYADLETDITTFGVLATLVTRADTPDDHVYELTRVVFEELDELRRMHPAFADLTPGRMIVDGLTAPMHPGAMRYYVEQGWLRPDR